eukprot:scaffold17364_cov73-Isochrysis_galbana.AAC.1
MPAHVLPLPNLSPNLSPFSPAHGSANHQPRPPTPPPTHPHAHAHTQLTHTPAHKVEPRLAHGLSACCGSGGAWRTGAWVDHGCGGDVAVEQKLEGSLDGEVRVDDNHLLRPQAGNVPAEGRGGHARLGGRGGRKCNGAGGRCGRQLGRSRCAHRVAHGRHEGAGAARPLLSFAQQGGQRLALVLAARLVDEPAGASATRARHPQRQPVAQHAYVEKVGERPGALALSLAGQRAQMTRAHFKRAWQLAAPGQLLDGQAQHVRIPCRSTDAIPNLEILCWHQSNHTVWPKMKSHINVSSPSASPQLPPRHQRYAPTPRTPPRTPLAP